MDRTVWINRFMRRMATLDVRLRPSQLAALAAAMFATDSAREPEVVAEEQGKDGLRRDD